MTRRFARPQVLALGNGWWKALVLDTFGGLIRDCGRWKGKGVAESKARAAARESNEHQARQPEPGERFGKADRKPYCVPAGDGTEIF